VATAKKALALAVKHLKDTWKTVGAGSAYKPAAGVPSYGDQQVAFSKTATVLSSLGSIAVVVRRRSVVWVLWALLDRDQPPKTSDVLADLKPYATKQKTRVGAG
jgi:hypothetical protein